MGLKIFINVIKELAAAADLEQVQRVVAKAARDLTGADGATIVFRDGDFCYYADEDAISPLWKGMKFPLGDCISGWVMLNNSTAVIPDIYTDPRIPVDAYRLTFVKSMVMVPVRTVDAVAAIGSYWSTYYVPSTTDLQLLEALADAAARTIENIHLVNRLEETVKIRTKALRFMAVERSREEEKNKRKLAGVLHDELGPTLALAKIKLSQLKHTAVDDVERNHIRDISQLLTDSIEFTRNLTFSLGSPVLTSLDFSSSIRLLASQFLEKNGIYSHLIQSRSPGALSADDKETMLSIVREIFININKHAKASYVKVDLNWSTSWLKLTVQDNGIGFDVNKQQQQAFETNSYGLFSITERLTYLNGTIVINSVPSVGTTITIQVPWVLTSPSDINGVGGS